MIFKTNIENFQLIKEELIDKLINAPGSIFDQVQKTDWKMKIRNKPYFDFIKPHTIKHIKKLIYNLYDKNNNKINGIINNVWYQIYTETSQHTWHTHPFTQFANVLFVELSNKGDATEFIDKKKIKVKEGDIITFPSWYLHRSPVIKSNNRKIVIAFNLDMENK
jgi:hypothetical protein